MGGIFWSMVFDWLDHRGRFVVGVAISMLATVVYVRAAPAGAAEAGSATVKLNLKFALRAYNRSAGRGRNPDAQGRMSTEYDDTFPDIGSMSDEELKDLIDELTDEEREVSYRRRVLHGKIDILRAELVNRLQGQARGRRRAITGADVQQLTDILLGKVRRRRRTSLGGRGRARWRCTAPSAASSTPRAPTTARSAVPTSAAPRAARSPRR